MAESESVSIAAVVEELGLSASRVRQLTNEGVLPSDRTAGGHRRYDLDAVRQAWVSHALARAGLDDGARTAVPQSAVERTPDVERVETLAGLAEDEVWSDLVPLLESNLSRSGRPAARAIAHYVFTEMLNNAVDHSDGEQVWIRIWWDSTTMTFEIQDDGVGVYARLMDGKHLPDLYAAVQELTKGKQTTAPERHTGEGIFFSSKAVDVFTLSANGISWTVDNLRSDSAVGASAVSTGTAVRYVVDLDTETDLRAIFDHFTVDTRFNRSRPTVKLFALGISFVSRSEAKRIASGLDEFSYVELDFTGVESVGQGFVDELFRVWANAHPATELIPTNMNDPVRFMVTRGLPGP